MLKEYPASQHRGEPTRRWFSDEYFDLIVWSGEDGAASGFQLCYDKQGNERSVTWSEQRGLRHDKIDNGEPSPTKNMSPILLAEGPLPMSDVLERFRINSGGIDQEIRDFVMRQLETVRA